MYNSQYNRCIQVSVSVPCSLNNQRPHRRYGRYQYTRCSAFCNHTDRTLAEQRSFIGDTDHPTKPPTWMDGWMDGWQSILPEWIDIQGVSMLSFCCCPSCLCETVFIETDYRRADRRTYRPLFTPVMRYTTTRNTAGVHTQTHAASRDICSHARACASAR